MGWRRHLIRPSGADSCLFKRSEPLPEYRKDAWGAVYKLFPEATFQRPDAPDRTFCRYFDERGENGVADLEECYRSTQPATEEEYDLKRSRYAL
jgi:hypothetical protein